MGVSDSRTVLAENPEVVRVYPTLPLHVLCFEVPFMQFAHQVPAVLIDRAQGVPLVSELQWERIVNEENQKLLAVHHVNIAQGRVWTLCALGCCSCCLGICCAGSQMCSLGFTCCILAGLCSSCWCVERFNHDFSERNTAGPALHSLRPGFIGKTGKPMGQGANRYALQFDRTLLQFHHFADDAPLMIPVSAAGGGGGQGAAYSLFGPWTHTVPVHTSATVAPQPPLAKSVVVATEQPRAGDRSYDTTHQQEQQEQQLQLQPSGRPMQATLGQQEQILPPQQQQQQQQQHHHHHHHHQQQQNGTGLVVHQQPFGAPQPVTVTMVSVRTDGHQT